MRDFTKVCYQDVREVWDGFFCAQNQLQSEFSEHIFSDSEALHQCQNGGTFLSGSQVQGCVCPDKFYGKFCEKK